ncbi:MAG: DNA-binding protein WhiA [Erysipelotrichaceae bacterium]|nr:DNA-binding protein WhiA [Erysipelotrichaceae bacterium]
MAERKKNKGELSFAMMAKEEIASHDFPEELQRSLLSGFAKTGGSLRLGEAGEELDLSSESARIAKTLYLLAGKRYGGLPHFAYSRSFGRGKKTRFHVLIPNGNEVLEDLKVDFLTGKINPEVVADDLEARCYLSGAFLASGSVNDPSSSNYHLEIAVSSQSYAKWLSHLINKILDHHFNAKVSSRRNQWIVYMKRSDQISEFLVLIGATEACLKFESVRIDREEVNIENRLDNLDAANMSKTLATGQRQVKQIEYLLAKRGFDAFPSDKSRALMKIRLAHPEASLGELAELLSEELSATVSKSNVNHLFRSLEELYLQEGGEA